MHYGLTYSCVTPVQSFEQLTRTLEHLIIEVPLIGVQINPYHDLASLLQLTLLRPTEQDLPHHRTEDGVPLVLLVYVTVPPEVLGEGLHTQELHQCE